MGRGEGEGKGGGKGGGCAHAAEEDGPAVGIAGGRKCYNKQRYETRRCYLWCLATCQRQGQGGDMREKGKEGLRSAWARDL